MSIKTLLSFVCVSAVLVVAVSAALDPPEPTAPRSARVVDRAPRPLLATASHGAEHVQAHTLRYVARVEVGGEVAYSLNLRGTWRAEPVNDGPEGVTIAAALSDASVEDPALAAQLATPFELRVDRDGRLVALAFEPSVGAGARNALRAIAALAQVVAPEGAQRIWEAPEQDATGRYLARYRRSGETLTKSLGAHTHVVGPDGLRPVADIGEASRLGRVEIELDAHGARRLEARDAVTLDLGQLAVALHAELDLARTTATGGALTLGALERVDLTQPLGVEEARGRASERLARRRPTAELLEALAATEGVERAELMVQLTAKVRQDPALAAELVAGLLEGRFEGAGATVVGALGSAHHPTAQRALVRLAEAGDGELEAAAIAQLGLGEAPTDETTRALEGWMDEADEQVHATATLAFGSAARGVGAERAVEMVDELLDRLDHAETPDQESLVLDALGNSGAPEATSAIRAALDSPDPRVRRAAVGALRNVPDPEAEPLLAEALASDPHPAVRLEAVRVAASRGAQPLLPALADALRADPERTVRLEVVVTLMRALGAPGVEALLVTAAEEDPDPEVRRVAERVVSRLAL